MNVGDKFKLNGYQVVATMDVAQGGGSPLEQNLVLMHNNSTHFLLAWREGMEATEARFIDSKEYWKDEEDDARVYAALLKRMVVLAESR